MIRGYENHWFPLMIPCNKAPDFFKGGGFKDFQFFFHSQLLGEDMKPFWFAQSRPTGLVQPVQTLGW